MLQQTIKPRGTLNNSKDKGKAHISTNVTQSHEALIPINNYIHYNSDKPVELFGSINSPTNQTTSKMSNEQHPTASVVQMLRLRLNDDVGENENFARMRQVTVSPAAHAAASNNPASPRLQKEITPSTGGVTMQEQLEFAFTSKYSGYGAPGTGSPFTLTANEDIIFEGHGSEIGIENFAPNDFAEKAAAVITRCGYNQANPWRGRIVLLGCETGRFTLATAQAIRGRVGFQVTVVGTQRDIRVNEDAVTHEMYAEDDWQAGDMHAPANLAAIVAFDRYINEQLSPLLTIRMRRVLNELSLLKAEARIAGLNDFDPFPPDVADSFSLMQITVSGLVGKLYTAIPDQPTEIDFANGLPNQLTHYNQAAVNNTIPIAPGTRTVRVCLDALKLAATSIIDARDGSLFSMAIWMEDFSSALIEAIASMNFLKSAFRRAKSRRIDFNDPTHFTSNTV